MCHNSGTTLLSESHVCTHGRRPRWLCADSKLLWGTPRRLWRAMQTVPTWAFKDCCMLRWCKCKPFKLCLLRPVAIYFPIIMYQLYSCNNMIIMLININRKNLYHMQKMFFILSKINGFQKYKETLPEKCMSNGAGSFDLTYSWSIFFIILQL